ncbi:MAG TPA: T9SS type A sorting domain-containing protein [Bacteroidota bacterium]|jgi:hypothetical protein|nr:T9SS type A sorting domain-containing protein [Bacteroidota bacterium]
MFAKLGLIALTLAAYTSAHAQQFQFTMHGADSLGHERTIVFGVHPQATFCADSALGEYNSFPPFPVMFSWTNPGASGICDNNDCFDCGRVSGANSPYPADLRPYMNRTQIDTYRVSMYSYDGGFPFSVSWEGDFSTYCDSMILTYTGSSAGVVVVDMFDTAAMQITDPSVLHADIIRWGAKTPPPPIPVQLYPPPDGEDIALPVTIRWRTAIGADSYRLQVSSDSLFVIDLHMDSTTTDTSKPVNDLASGEEYYWRVKAQKNESSSNWSEVRRFRTIIPSVSLRLSGHWNLVSLPLNTSPAPKSAVFPTSQTTAYYYSLVSQHYMVSDSLSHGVGYWLRFSSDQEVRIEGVLLETDTVSLMPGWNLVGSIATPVAVSSIISDPPGLATSSFYGYKGRYEPSDTIHPGEGYWVRVSEPARLILSPASVTGALSKTLHVVQTTERPPASPADEFSSLAPSTSERIPDHFNLGQNFPNPFNPTTSIRYELATPERVRLVVYDIIGKEIRTLVDGLQPAGFYDVQFVADHVESGVYFYRLTAGQFTSVQKMLLLK